MSLARNGQSKSVTRARLARGRVLVLLVAALIMGCAGLTVSHTAAAPAPGRDGGAIVASDDEQIPSRPDCRGAAHVVAVQIDGSDVEVAPTPLACVVPPAEVVGGSRSGDVISCAPSVRRALLQVFLN